MRDVEKCSSPALSETVKIVFKIEHYFYVCVRDIDKNVFSW